MPPTDARIGPNAILQTIQVLDQQVGRATRGRVMALAGVAVPPADAGMLPEAHCAAVHRAVRLALPDRAAALLRLSGLATGDYILRHRIPRLVQALLLLLPRRVAARILTSAITRHAWTFVGSGTFRVTGAQPLIFDLSNNPLIEGESADQPLCQWHAAVFERLFCRLIWPSVTVKEVSCIAAGASSCRFHVQPLGRLAPEMPRSEGQKMPARGLGKGLHLFRRRRSRKNCQN